MICLGLLFKFRETVKEHMDDEAAFIRRLKKSFIYASVVRAEHPERHEHKLCCWFSCLYIFYFQTAYIYYREI